MIIYFRDQHNNNLNNWSGLTVLNTDLLEDMELHKGICMVAFRYRHLQMTKPIVLPFYFDSAADAENFFEDIQSSFFQCKSHLDLTLYKLTVPERLYKMVRYGSIIKDNECETVNLRKFFK